MLNVHSRDSIGDTPLHIACRRNLLEVVQWLVETRCSPLHTKNLLDQTPLDIAVELNYRNIVSYIQYAVVLQGIQRSSVNGAIYASQSV